MVVSASYRLTDLALPYLLDDSEISFHGKGLYILICHFQPQSFAHLARVSGIDRQHVERECTDLRKKEWLIFDTLAGSPTIITPTAPDRVQEKLVETLVDDQESWFPAGEKTMKAMLDNAVASSDYIDNSRPRHVTNPKTGHPLEFDRLYKQGVAFEFQGIQHRERTSLHQSDEEFEEAQTRDLVKMALSAKLEIEVVEITETDLTMERIIAKIPKKLEILRIDRSSKYIHRLDRLGHSYMAWCKRKRKRESRSG